MNAHFNKSQELFSFAQEHIVGGVNSPVRAFKSVGGTPVFIDRAKGAHLWDVDGNSYIDFLCSWGPLIHGHAPEPVLAAIQEAAQAGTSFGAPTPRETELAQLVKSLVPSIDLIRFVNSGTEATMSAIRLARGHTGRPKFIKFEGCYHGHADALLAEAGSGVATLGIPGSPGVPAGAVADTLTAPYNDVDAVEKLFEANKNEVAAIIVEPVAGNMGLVLPQNNFLSRLRELCDAHGALLIFDEVMTGFRVAKGGAQARFDIDPDLTCFGKVIGGGLPVGAYGGKKEIMENIAPVGNVYQAGTLSGNPLAMAAGIASLRGLNEPGFYENLESLGSVLEQGIKDALNKHNHEGQVLRCGTMFYLWFGRGEAPSNYNEVKAGDVQKYSRFFSAALAQGLNFAPSGFEVGFFSSCHTLDIMSDAIAKIDLAMKDL